MITTRHEQATTYMADGYARSSDKPGVALVVPGVGLYNAAAGIATAFARSSPVLVVAGQIPRSLINKNRGAVHEILNQPDTVRPVTKWRGMALTPQEAADTVNEAFRQLRSGRPRPVLVEIPPETAVERDYVVLRDPVPAPRPVPGIDRLNEAVRAITLSKLPVILAGEHRTERLAVHYNQVVLADKRLLRESAGRSQKAQGTHGLRSRRGHRRPPYRRAGTVE